MRRVVITGTGAVSAFGAGSDALWTGLTEGRSTIRHYEIFQNERFSINFGGYCEWLDPLEYLEKRDLKKVDRHVTLSVAAAKHALENAGWREIDDESSMRFGVCIGITTSGLQTMEDAALTLQKRGASRVSPWTVPASLPQMGPSWVSIIHKLRGPVVSVGTNCSAGTHGVGHAFDLIRLGRADRMLAGGAEGVIHPFAQDCFANMRAHSKRSDEPEKACRPFDRDRDGLVLAEGAGLVVMEELEFAKARGADILAEVVGFGLSGDAYHMTNPEPSGEGAVRCILDALNDAHLNPTDICYINAHGTSTPANDSMESRAFETVFGDHAKTVWVSSNKSMLGHTMGASGGIEAVATALTISQSVVPPTINLDNPDPECRLDYVPHTAREGKIDAALSTSFGFGGTNAAIILKRFTG